MTAHAAPCGEWRCPQHVCRRELEREGEAAKEAARKRPVTLNIDGDVDAKLDEVARLTRRSRSSVANLVLHRGLDIYAKDPDLL